MPIHPCPTALKLAWYICQNKEADIGTMNSTPGLNEFPAEVLFLLQEPIRDTTLHVDANLFFFFKGE